MTTPQTREHHNQENRLDNKHGDHSWDTELVPSKLMPQSLDAAFFVLPGPIASLSALRTVHHHLHGGGTTRMPAPSRALRWQARCRPRVLHVVSRRGCYHHASMNANDARASHPPPGSWEAVWTVVRKSALHRLGRPLLIAYAVLL